jgi:hypothetical protein
VRRPPGLLGVASLDCAAERSHQSGPVLKENVDQLRYGLPTLVATAQRGDEASESGVLERLACVLRTAARQCARELVDANRLGEIVVHPRCEALLAVALHRVRRHGDDRRPFF